MFAKSKLRHQSDILCPYPLMAKTLMNASLYVTSCNASEQFWWLSVCIKVCACMSSGGGGLTSVVAAIERLGQLATAGPASSEQVEPSSDVCRCCHRGLTCSPPPTWATCHQPPEAAPASTSATLQPDFRNHSPEVHRDKKGS